MSTDQENTKTILIPRKYYNAMRRVISDNRPKMPKYEAIPIEERLRRRLTITTANALFERRTGKSLKADAEQQLAAAKATRSKRPKGFAPTEGEE